MKTLAIVVPCYNEEETIHPFLEACQAVERQMTNQLAFNYYFVNDGSKDRTLEVLRQVSKQFENMILTGSRLQRFSPCRPQTPTSDRQ